MKIQAAVFAKTGRPFEIETLDLAEPKAGEVLVKVKAAGVCHSDWHLVTGATKYITPTVPGHEGSGIVEAVGPNVTRVKIGDHVALNWAPSCGACFYCLRDRPSLCSAYASVHWGGTLLDGTTRLSLKSRPVFHFSCLSCFAERAVVPEQCCVPVNKLVPFDVLALAGCAVTTGVGAALITTPVLPGSSVAIFGAGGVGLSVLLGASLAGATSIIVVDRTPAKARIAKALGATGVILDANVAVDLIRKASDGRGVDYAFEATGIPKIQTICVDAVRPGGKAVFVGISPMESTASFSTARITRQEKSIIGSYYGSTNPHRDIPFLMDLYLAKRLPLQNLVSKRWKLAQINQAYEWMLRGKNARNVVVFD